METLDTTPTPLNVGFNRDLEAQAPVAAATPFSPQQSREKLIRGITGLAKHVLEGSGCTVEFKPWEDVLRLQRINRNNFRDTGVIKFKGRPVLSIDIGEWDTFSSDPKKRAYAITSYFFATQAAYDKLVAADYKTLLGQGAKKHEDKPCISFPQRTSLDAQEISRPTDSKNFEICFLLATDGDFETRLIRNAELAEKAAQQQAASKSVVGKALDKLVLALKI